MSATTDEILALEKGFWTQADNPRFFEENAADDLITVLEPVGFIDKQQGLKMIADRPWKDVEMFDVQVREPIPGCVTLAYHGQGIHEGDDEPYRGSIASTYVKRDGHWQLVLTAHQPWKPKEGTAE
jgi:uncharacterized protein DUF4440